MFDIAEQLNNKWDGRSGVRIQDGYFLRTEEERRTNSLMWIIENKVNTKTLEQGFTIEVVKGAGVTDTVADPNNSPYLAQLWDAALRKVNCHRLRFGYCVVQKRTIRDPFSIPAEEEQAVDEAVEKTARRSNLPQQSAISDAAENPESNFDDEVAEFLASERTRLNRSKPRAAPSMKNKDVLGYEVPYVLDPLQDCYVKFFIGPDKQRIYKAFPRTAETQNTQPLEDAIVIVFNEPDAFGVPESAFLACLEDLQTVRGMLQRWEQRDYVFTHPPWVYKSVPRGAGEAVIPADTHITLAETGTEDPSEHGLRPKVWKDPVRIEDQTVKKRLAQLELSNRYMDKALDDSVAKAVPVGTQVRRPQYNAQLEKLTTAQPIDEFGPYHIIPDQMELAPNVPRPMHPGDWMAIYNLYVGRVASATGVTTETLSTEHSLVSADAESRRAEGDSAIRAAQTHLERTIAHIYVSIFMPIHRAEIESSAKQLRYKRRLAALDKSEEDHQNRVLLHREIAELKEALLRNPEEGEVRTKLHDDKRIKKGKLAEIPPLDIDADEMPWDDKTNYTGDTGLKRLENDMLMGDVDEFYQISMEAQLQVNVHIRENPSITYADARTLYTDKLITRERFGQIALRTLGLPEDYLATDEELDKESKVLAQREKRYNEDSGTNDMASKDGESQSPKRVKTDNTTPDQGL